jgi:DNA-binding IclR family transcriptional regulator
LDKKLKEVHKKLTLDEGQHYLDQFVALGYLNRQGGQYDLGMRYFQEMKQSIIAQKVHCNANAG